MKKGTKRIIWIVVIITIIYVVLNIGVSSFGKKLLVSRIESIVKQKTSVQGLNISFPLTVNINSLNIEGLFKADFISASPSILGFLAGKIVLNELKVIRPELTIVRNHDNSYNLPKFDSKGKPPQVFLAGLKIRNGKFIFFDKKSDTLGSNENGYKVAVNSIYVNVSKIIFPPTSLFTRFKLSALVGDSQGIPKGRISGAGWIDFGKKDMDGKLELSDMDATYLAPYYGGMISTKKLVSAKLNFTTGLKAKNNNLTVKCHTEFSDVIYEKPAEKTEKISDIDLVPNAMKLFSDATGKIVFDFSINTKLDNPRIDLLNMQGTMAQAAGQNLANQNPADVIQKIKDNVDQFKQIGKDLKEMFKKKE